MIRLKTFGGLSLESAGPMDGRGAQRRRLALLAGLAAARGAPISRDKLLGWFWPEHDTAAARHALAQAVYQIRRSLGDSALLGGPADDLRLNPDVVTSDLREFEDALAAGDLERAVALYAGPFLDGFFVTGAPEFERWVSSERDRLARACAGALEGLARAAAGRGEPANAARWWERTSQLDPLDARATLEAMRACVAAGDRARALKHAARHGAAWREALDSAPDAAVARLAAELQATAPALVVHAPAQAVPAVRAVPAVPTVRPAYLVRIAAALVVAAVGSGFLLVRQLRTAVPVREVVLGSVESSDSALGLAVREALRAELEGTPGLRVTSDPTVRETMRLMHLPPESGLSTDVTVEVAQRRGAPFAVAAAAFPLAGGASLTVRVLDAQDGRLIATLTADPTEQQAILREVTRLARAVRERITGSPSATPAPLPRVTTASLPALRNYVLARQALGRGDRKRAIELARGALAHDSLFALAHYFLGDQLWFVDQQRSSEYHLRRANELSSALPPRERLLIRARYQQLVLDRPDSAAITWEQLRSAFPDDITACEGLAWTYRSLGRFDEAVAASLAAIGLDSTAIVPNARAAIYAWYALADTTAAARFVQAHRPAVTWAESEVRWYTAMLRGDAAQALREVEAQERGAPLDSGSRLQLTHLVAGRLADAEKAMSYIVAGAKAQFAPRALLAQAEGEMGLGGSPDHAAALVREALAWLDGAELSPPAVARIAERIGAVAARAGDTLTLTRVERLLRREDRGRGLRSFQLALEAIAAERAFVHGAFADAARLAARAGRASFLWRSMSPLVLLEADALAAAGRRDEADARYRSLDRWPLKLDADYETAFVTRAIVERRLATGGAPQVGMRNRP